MDGTRHSTWVVIAAYNEAAVIEDVVRAVVERLHSAGGGATSTPMQGLSAQEQRVALLVAEGKTNKEIAAAMGLSDRTVKNYLANIFHKLKITRRSQAASIVSAHSVQ